MTEQEKRKLFFDAMSEKGAKRKNLKPPIYRGLWALGINVAPPLYASGAQVFLIHVALLGGFFGFFMWLIAWRDSPGFAFFGGLFYGLFMGLFSRLDIEKHRNRLGIEGDWASYEPDRNPNAEQASDGKPDNAVS